MTRTRPWTMREVRALLEQVPMTVRNIEATAFAYLWDQCHGMGEGPKRAGPELLGPIVAFMLSAHGVQVED